ncbi:hypothetical protein GCM10020358_47130 [Amorphoplanes nipponensis]|uniref:Uncharacterized protein n=1 Tax=Actinoplanes nipponensis TaxID=135950 RepID=A0A919MPD8_9ACTN|nr:hypothetical protein [Actinoplanes nipponensis]GIE49413.1 hypothetical protein Ani05nite_29470 [Actinoplanes nipponensis]
MPDRDAEAPQHTRLLTVLIWAGVGLAPIAALVALLGGSDSSIRFAVLLVAVCVVLIGAALLVRNDPVLLRMDAEDQAAILRDELREEIAAGVRASGRRVQALQDEMTRMRAAGSPALGLAPAGARAAGVARPGATGPGVAGPGSGGPGVGDPGFAGPGAGGPGFAGPGAGGPGFAGPGAGGPGFAGPGGPAFAGSGARGPGFAGPGGPGVGGPGAGGPAVPGPGGGPGVAGPGAGGPIAAGRPVVATASVAPAGGHPSVARAAVASASVGSASVGSASVAAAAVPAGVAPRQRGSASVPPAGGRAYQDVHDDSPSHSYGPGPSGSAWAERGSAAEDDAGGYAAEAPAEARPSRRHAAPDTGTDLARYGLGDPATGPDPYGTVLNTGALGSAEEEQGYDAAGYDPGAAAWTAPGNYDYPDPGTRERPDPGGFGAVSSPFFAQDASGGFLLDNEYPQPDAEGYDQPSEDDSPPATTYGRPAGAHGRADQYGPDPLAADHGWAPRSHEQRGRW